MITGVADERSYSPSDTW